MPVPRWQLGTLPVHTGHLRVKDEYLGELGRYSRLALLVPLTPGAGALQLQDVVLLGSCDNWLTLAGLERTEQGTSYADYAQTWLVTPRALSGGSNVGG